jgi:DinB superfamily
MKRTFAPLAVVVCAVLALFFAGYSQAQKLSPGDKDKALQLLESTKKDVLDATRSLSEAQWNFKSASDRWSVAECMEHIAAAEDFIRGLIIEKIMVAPAPPAGPDRDVVKIDAGIIANVPDRTNKVQAPEPLKPTNRFGSPQGSIGHFVETRAKTEDFLKTTPGLRDHAIDSPGDGKYGKWDAYEFVLLITAHSERHTNQIKEVKADPNFPKN